MTSASQHGAHAGVYEAEKRRTRAMVDGDVAALAVLLDIDCRYVHSSGAVDTKAGYLEKLRAGDIGYSWIRPSDQLIIESRGRSGGIGPHGGAAGPIRSAAPVPESRRGAVARDATRSAAASGNSARGPASSSCAPTASSRDAAGQFLWPQTPCSIRSQAGLRPRAWALTATARQR
jgi:hypothetical protein